MINKIIVILMIYVNFRLTKANQFINLNQSVTYLLKCDCGRVFEIIDAKYGYAYTLNYLGSETMFESNEELKKCYVDATDTVSETCSDFRKCVINVNDKTFGKPCKGYKPYVLAIEYDCVMLRR